jgi:hypothetical protein
MGWDDETIRQSIDRLHRLKINRLRVLVYGRNNPRPWGTPVVPTENFKLHLNPWVAERPDDIENPGLRPEAIQRGPLAEVRATPAARA